MTKEDGIELIERIPFITVFEPCGSKSRIDAYKKAVSNKKDPVQWIKVIKSDFLHKETAAGKINERLEKEYAARAKQKLHELLAQALEIKQEEVELFITQHIKNMDQGAAD